MSSSDDDNDCDQIKSSQRRGVCGGGAAGRSSLAASITATSSPSTLNMVRISSYFTALPVFEPHLCYLNHTREAYGIY
ncbi:hypothetical protein E2C01_002782 [Portunus trituberculatus]|uniref:Uncharacterized protein n=1 Tax=Portunus trituberculatus TaxID=210409 RepID=A0A5B7CRN0_PORTR|nr:hypothetical protein [Portunus trituberculatus]